jgi:predicted acylesterase/phospholipase RssA
LESGKLNQRFQILALDGGGIRGLFSAAVLAHVEEDLGIDVSHHFDLIVGTSTGGIIALGLGLGLRAKEIVDFYAKHGPRIFRNVLGVRAASHWLVRKFPQKHLCSALRAPDIFGNKTLGDSRKPLVITSYNLGEDDIYLFKTPHHPDLVRDWRVPAWQVALATSAAPTYFPLSRDIHDMRLVDGGIWANNPTMVGIIEAADIFGASFDQISVLNLGTSSEILKRPARLNWAGKALWAKPAVDLVMRAQSLGAYKQSIHLIGRNDILRIDPKVPEGLFKLDKAKCAKELKAKAAYESRSLIPEFKRKFVSHVARPYTPYHKR